MIVETLNDEISMKINSRKNPKSNLKSGFEYFELHEKLGKTYT